MFVCTLLELFVFLYVLFILYCWYSAKKLMTVEQVYESVDLLVEKCTILEVSSVII